MWTPWYSTLKFYTEEGMLPFEHAEETLTRRYNRVESIQRVSLINAPREEGKTIPEIKALLVKHSIRNMGGRSK